VRGKNQRIVSGQASETARAENLLEVGGAGDEEHPSAGTLLAHLRATHDRLERWGCPLHLRLAGLCHSVYGTEGFPTALFSLSDRDRVREHVGAEAEELIHLFCVMTRRSLYEDLGGPAPHHVVDRTTGRAIRLRDDRQLIDLLMLDVANGLEHPPGMSLWRLELERRRFDKAIPYLPALAGDEVRAAFRRRSGLLIAGDALVRGTRRIARRMRGEREISLGRVARVARRWYRRATTGVTNPFDSPAAAHRYAEGRPDYHDEVSRQVAGFLGSVVPVPRAVDVGCGTGQSTRALARVARQVVGLDASEFMARQARSRADHPVAVATAERLPLADRSVDMIVASAAFHWFDQPRFLAEARRVARPGAWLVVYDNGFSDVEGVEGARRWHEKSYLAAFPPPPRNAFFSTRLAARAGFVLRCDKRYVNRVQMDAEALARFLVTQSNVIIGIAAGRGTADEIAERFRVELEPFFRANGEPVARTCLFGGPLRILQLTGA
jgi:SAM-dependent methyltransferase